MVTAVREPRAVAVVRGVPHCVALGQQRAITLKVQNSSRGVAIGVLHVGHHNLSSDDLWMPEISSSALSNGCSWYARTDGSGHFCYGGKRRDAPFGFVSGDEVSAVVDRRTHSDNVNGNGVVRFLRNGKALDEADPLPVGFPEEAMLVVCFSFKGGSVNIVSFE